MRKLFLTILTLVSAIAASAQTDIKVQTHNVVAADEQFNVTFIIEGESKPADFVWEPGDDFQLLWGPQQGRSTSVQMINGKTTKSVQTTYSYVLRPVKAGKFTIGRASAKVKGQDIYSDPVTIEVVASGASSSGSQPSGSIQGAQQSQRQSQSGIVQDDDIFLTMELSRINVVVGEPVTATIKLYQRVNVAGFESAEFPTFNGFWSQELEAPTNIEFARETYDGQIYNSALLRKFVLIPQQQGQVRIDPAELVCLVNVRVSAGGASIFDGFFDDYRTVRKKVSSKPVTVNVSPLPAGAPASFAGGVGEFRISAELSKDTIRTHEAASLLVTVTGKGNVSLLEAPKISFPPDMEVYDTKISEKIDRGGLTGSKYYEYPFIPRSHGEFVIEPVKYSYYDVNQKKYVTLETPPIPITVERGNEADAGGIVVTGNVQKDVRNLGSDIRFINTKAAGLSSKGEFFVGSAIFWIIISLLIAVAAACWAALRHLAARKADVVGTKNRKATKMALRRLQLAGTFLKQNLYTAFYEELHKALLGFISDKLNMPASELSRERITEALKEGNVNEELIGTFIGILDACEFARYAPDAGHEAMAAHYQSAVDVISSIDSEMKVKKTNGKGAMLLLIMLMAMPAVSSAQQKEYVDSLWNAANQAYAEGRWADALADYEMISGMGLESASLYCNTGDAYYKDGNLPKAILYYEKALKLDPSYDDARFNLELLNSGIQDRIEPVPEFVLKAWSRKVCYIMDSDAWAVCFIVFLALTLAMALMFILSPSVAGRRTGFFTGLVMILFAAFSLTFSIWQKKDYMRADDAIVMRPVTSVKSSPSSEASKDLFILHEGTKVRIIDEVGSWNNIELADGRQGWIPSGDIETI
ncbi:MAG: BatD family protein [Bacteroidales bacterium]|nr:BatD family protein [Bacteroidales bacterium]